MSPASKGVELMKKMDFYAAHAMVKDMMHSTNAPFVCLLKMGDYTSLMCNNIYLTDVLVTLMAHAWNSMRKHGNSPLSSAKAILSAALGFLEKENARLSDEDITDMIREIQSMGGIPASNLDEVVQ